MAKQIAMAWRRATKDDVGKMAAPLGEYDGIPPPQANETGANYYLKSITSGFDEEKGFLFAAGYWSKYAWIYDEVNT